MKRLIIRLLAFAALTTGTLLAQDITGIWQGTLTPPGGKDLRIVLKIAKTDDAKLKGTFFSIDQSPQGIPTGVISLQSGAVKFTMTGIGDYDGKLTSDGTAINGNWTQGSPLQLNFKHVTEATAWAMPAAPEKLPPMAADADPSFEVATIKPSAPDAQGKVLTLRGREFFAVNFTLDGLVSFAYDLHPKQITNAAPRMESDKFDITGLPNVPGQPNSAQLKIMVRKLLTERFKLSFHHDRKELSVYALTVNKSAPKIARSDADAGSLPSLFFPALGKLNVRNATIPEFTQLMQSTVLDRPVVDQTGLTGRYDFTLNWTPDESQFGGLGTKVPPPSDKAEAPPSLFTAVQEQMGMKLEATKAPVDVLVIDHVEKPSEN
jgi:uncharacterized protein (TIGR03435 family)